MTKTSFLNFNHQFFKSVLIYILETFKNQPRDCSLITSRKLGEGISLLKETFYPDKRVKWVRKSPNLNDVTNERPPKTKLPLFIPEDKILKQDAVRSHLKYLVKHKKTQRGRSEYYISTIRQTNFTIFLRLGLHFRCNGGLISWGYSSPPPLSPHAPQLFVL